MNAPKELEVPLNNTRHAAHDSANFLKFWYNARRRLVRVGDDFVRVRSNVGAQALQRANMTLDACRRQLLDASTYESIEDAIGLGTATARIETPIVSTRDENLRCVPSVMV